MVEQDHETNDSIDQIIKVSRRYFFEQHVLDDQAFEKLINEKFDRARRYREALLQSVISV